MASPALQVPNGSSNSQRPGINSMQSSPSVVMNGHFASVGEKSSAEQYEHGVQVIDENKEFK